VTEGVIWSILVPMFSSLLGAGIGGIVVMYGGQSAMRSKIESMQGEIAEFKSDVHDTLKRVVFRDVCDRCGKHGDDRHSEVIRQLAELRSALTGCFDDLVEALKSGSSPRMRTDP